MPRITNQDKLERIRAGLWDVRAGLRLLAPFVSKPTELGLQRIFSAARNIEHLEDLESLIIEVENLWGRIEDSNGCFYKLKDYIAAEFDSRNIKGEKR